MGSPFYENDRSSFSVGCRCLGARFPHIYSNILNWQKKSCPLTAVNAFVSVYFILIVVLQSIPLDGHLLCHSLFDIIDGLAGGVFGTTNWNRHADICIMCPLNCCYRESHAQVFGKYIWFGPKQTWTALIEPPVFFFSKNPNNNANTIQFSPKFDPEAMHAKQRLRQYTVLLPPVDLCSNNKNKWNIWEPFAAVVVVHSIVCVLLLARGKCFSVSPERNDG